MGLIFVLAQAGGALFPSLTGVIASQAGVKVVYSTPSDSTIAHKTKGYAADSGRSNCCHGGIVGIGPQSSQARRIDPGRTFGATRVKLRVENEGDAVCSAVPRCTYAHVVGLQPEFDLQDVTAEGHVRKWLSVNWIE